MLCHGSRPALLPRQQRVHHICKPAARSACHSAADRGAAPALHHLREAGLGLASCVGSLLLLAAQPCSAADDMTIRFPASTDPEIRQAQQVLVESWAYVDALFLDPAYNGKDWHKLLKGALTNTFEAKSKDEVYQMADALLKELNDPFTRILRPQAARTFENERGGRVIASGIGLAQDVAGKLRVAFLVDGSPAKGAGLAVGDQLVAIDDEDVLKKTPREVARALSKRAEVRLLRADTAAAATASPQVYSVQLEPSSITLSPVQYAAIRGNEQVAAAGDGNAAVSTAGAGEGVAAARVATAATSSSAAAPAPAVGYLKIIQFTDATAGDVDKALRDLEGQGVSSYILDLRDNPGGTVNAGLEVAKDFLHDGDVFCYTNDRNGEQLSVVEGAHPLTTKPAVVLVNNATASTSELLAGALHDGYGAQLIGERTFGKGRTQRVINLSDGSILLVSNVGYITPKRTVVDHVGLSPEVACKPDVVESIFWQPGSVDGEEQRLLDDPCIDLAYSKLTGVGGIW